MINSTVLLAITCVFALFALFHAVAGIVTGVRHLFRIFRTAGIPGQLSNGRTAVRELCRKRTIHFAQDTGSVSAAGALLPRFRYLTRPQRTLLEALGRSIGLWLLFLAILASPRFVPDRYLQQLPGFLSLSEPWPLPVHLALVGAFSITALVLAVLTSVRRTPRVAVNEQRIELEGGGNPVDMFLQMRHTFEDIRLGDFPNRDILIAKPNLGRSREGETDSFTGELIVERQPEPMSRGLSVNAMILDTAGAALRCAGFALVLYNPVQGPAAAADGPPLNVAGLAAAAMLILAGIAAARSGSWCLRTAYHLHHVFRFGSDIYWLLIEGTYSVGHSGLGDGRGGQVHVGRAHMQSRCHVHLYATRAVSECQDLHGDRVIVDCRPDVESQGRLEHLVGTLESMEGKGERLPMVDLADRGVSEIVEANVQIERLQSAARQNAAEQSQLGHAAQPRLPGGAPDQGDAVKECPECAEKVRVAAKKCRFCGYRFGEEGTSASDGTSTG